MEKIITVKYGQPCPNHIPTFTSNEQHNYRAGMIVCEHCCWCKGDDFGKGETHCRLIA